jgi:hypothetical protein
MGITFDLHSSGAVAINNCTSKYGLRLWSARIRLFYQYPHKEYEFCRRVLLKTASGHPPFTIELGNIRQSARPEATSLLRWHLAPSTEFIGLYNELRNQLSPLSTQIARRVRNTKLGEQDFPEKGKAPHWNLRELRELRNPSIFMPKSQSSDAAQTIQKTLESIQKEYKDKVLILRVVGLNLGYHPTRTNLKREFEEYPF